MYASACRRWSVRTCASWSVYQKLEPVGEVVTEERGRHDGAGVLEFVGERVGERKAVIRWPSRRVWRSGWLNRWPKSRASPTKC